MKLKSMKGYISLTRQLVIAVALTLFAHTTLGIAFYQNQVFKHGAVMARAMALDENGQPILVEYNADGSEAGEVALGEYADKVNRLHIISAYEYTTQYSRWKEFTDRPNNPLAQDAQLLNVEQYEQATFVTASGEPITKPGLLEHQKSVLVRGRSNRLTTDPSQLILMSFSVDLTQSPPPDDAVSLVMNEHGQIIASSPLNIAPRAGFFGDPTEAQDFYSGYIRKTDDQIFGPVPFIKVYVDEWVYPGGVDVTDSEGKYRLNFRLPPCPGFSFEHTTDVWAELYYTNFSPNGAPVLPYYLRRQDWSFCHGVAMYDMSLGGAMAYTNAVASLATMSVPNYAIDLRVDVMFLTGRILIGNPGGSPDSVVPIPIGDVTEYAAKPLDENTFAQQQYDFDGDGEPDRSVLGNLFEETLPDGSTVKLFKPAPDDDGKYALQGVYFSSRTDQTGDPDVIRQADNKKELGHNGLLSSISEDDFKNTDILVFRESTGQLVMERRGLRDAEIDGRAQVGLGQNDDNVFYRIMLRGPRDSSINIGGTNRSGSWDDWASRNKLTTSFQSQQSDHLKPGEWIRLVVINRATGYMGTQRIQLSDASQNPGGYLNVPVEDIVMRPPNLKIWAERTYQVEHGLSADGEDRRFLIGAEGAGLVDDALIEVYSEWYDHDGRPLPEGLGVDSGEDYGLSGRLAKVVSDDYIEAESDLAIFPIGPGRQTQLLKIKDNLTVPEHFYIHVSGTQKDESPQFDAAGNVALEPFNSRPRTLTPFLAPLYDENKDWETYNAYRDLLREQAEAETPDPDAVTPQKPLPSYVWSYRPEYQFSQYDLEIAEINRVNLNEQGEEEKENILDLSTPVISSGDQLIEFLYSFAGNTGSGDQSSLLDRLSPIDGPQDLVLALGEEEVKLTLGQNQQIRIENIEHLASLSPEDFLTMRLYVNQDAGNILWEYAFWTLNAEVADDDVLQGDGIYYVNADKPTVDLMANLAGYSVLRDEIRAKAPQRIYWRVISGNASLNPAWANIDDSGSVITTVNLNPNSSNIAYIEAYLIDGEGSATSPITIGVIPGKPANISVTSTGTTYLKGKGSIQLEATVRDRNSNLVTNGTGVLIREHGHINVQTSTGITDQGKVQATLTGGSIAGNYQVDVLSGEAIASTNVSVASLNVAMNGIPAALEPGKVYQLTATVSGSSENLGGIFLDLGADGGMISHRDTVTDANGELSFSYRAPKQPGSYNLGVKLDLNDPQLFGLTVGTATVSPSVAPEREYVVAGTADRSGSITNFRGQSATVNYSVQSQIALKGVANSAWSLSLDDPHLPNVEPVYFSRFNEIFWDSTRQYASYGENVFKVPSLHDGLYAISQDQSTVLKSWQLVNSNDFVINNPSYNFWLNLGGSGEVISIANGSISLNYSAGVLQATAQSLDSSAVNQTSVASISGLSENQWYAVAISIENGNLTLSVDQQQTTTVMAGTSPNYNSVTDDSPWLSLADGFTGKIAGLRIYDLNKAPLLQLTQSSGVFNAAGLATAAVELTSIAKQADIGLASVTVGLVDNANNVSTMNILSKQTLDNMALAMHSVSTESSMYADDVIQKMPLHQYFPDPKMGVSNYVASFALRSHANASVENVLANLSWLKLESKYPVLHDDIEALQSYFADVQHPDLAHYAAEYLQEATVQASHGNNFWLRAMATTFKVWAEMVASNPNEANQIASAIQNRTDFWAWVRILSIPANGWATDSVPVPRPDITCDKVSPTVNVGTALEYSAEPCRASGAQMAALVQTLNEIDPDTLAHPELLTTYFMHILAGTQQMPIEYKKWFSGTDSAIARNINSYLFPEAHAAIPAVVGYAFRAMAVALKQTLRKAAGGAPANFVAFMQGGTTSRLKPEEILPAIAYLTSRFDDASDTLCNGCKRLETQVSDTVKEDIAAWFISLGLSRKGEIADEKQKSKSCSIAYLNHGKGFEVLGTAMYHALYEFGDLAGLSNPEQYQILLSDPRTSDTWIDVGLMKKKSDSTDLALYNKFQRKPDLVLFGEGEGKRTWVELKSWLYNPATLGEAKHWEGFKSESDYQYTNANRQHFLDFAASQDELLDEYWRNQRAFLENIKPSKHQTWFQVWKGGSRTWRELKKDANGKYYLEKNPIHRSVARPWIDTDGIVSTVDNNFQELQKFLAGVSTRLDAGMYESSIGHKKSEHNTKYRDRQVSTNFAELLTSNIRPFNVKTFLALELGDSSDELVAKVKSEIYEAVGDGDFTRLQKAIDDNSLTEAQIEQLRELISDEINTMLGPLQYLLFDIPGLSYVEDKLADAVIGEELEAARQKAVEYELPEDTFENFCEDQ